MATLAVPDIAGQLEKARREAADLRTQLDQAEGEQAQAAEAKDYDCAAELKRKADGLRPHVLLAESHVQALQQAADGLREHARREGAAQAEKERQEQAQEAHAAATAAEQKAIAESERLLTRAREQLAEARQSLRAALDVEATAGHHRQEAYQVAVGAGWQEPSAFGVAMPNLVEAAIEYRPLLRAVLQATE